MKNVEEEINDEERRGICDRRKRKEVQMKMKPDILKRERSENVRANNVHYVWYNS